MKEIQLTQGKTAIVDDEDHEYLSQFKWHAVKNANAFYAQRAVRGYGGKKNLKMHREILGLTDPKIFVDHKDHNGLNNQRNNIRIANYSQNAANSLRRVGSSSKYKGVCWRSDRNKWQSQIRMKDVFKFLGLHTKETDAALAYNKAAIEIYGDFANINKI